MLWIFCLCLDC